MTYTTGSGDYNAMMASVLAHATTDGWTTTGGLWPISKGNVKGVDWNTYTVSESDFTLLGGASKTARYVNVSVGTSPANATTNAALDATSVRVPNMEYTLTSWAIYSDPTLCDYIHVVFNFSNGINGDCWGHFGFGELDKQGMTHTAVVYATASPKRGYAASNANDIASDDWNGGMYSRSAVGYTGYGLHNWSSLFRGNGIVYIIDGLVSPVPGSGWPVVDTLNTDAQVLNCLSLDSGAIGNHSPSTRLTGRNFKWSTWPSMSQVQPYSGAVTMGPLPFFILQNLTTNAAQTMYLGSFPNVRCCSMNSYTPGDQVTFATEDWDLYPWLRKTDWSQTNVQFAVTSGEAGYSHKRVL